MTALQVLRTQIWLIAVLLVFIAAGLGIGVATNLSFRPMAYLRFLAPTFACVSGALLWRAVRVLLRRPPRPMGALREDLREYLTVERVMTPLPALILLPIFFSVFTMLKRAIPLLNPYRWDATFAELDRVIHGGYPWELLHPILAHSAITHAIDTAYILWFFVFYAVLFWQVFRTDASRSQFLLSMVLTWGLLGIVSATLFSSGGPCFYGRLTGLDDPFAPLLAYLRAEQVAAVQVQDALWGAYMHNDLTFGSGISAMPSMHVGIAFLCALAVWRANRLLGTVMFGFASVILIGSVHLGWHYAIDGYAGIAGVWIIWALVGWRLAIPRPIRKSAPAL